MNSELRISEAAMLLGVTPHYLPMLEWEGRIPQVAYERVGRFYTEADIELLKRIGVGSKPRRLCPVQRILGTSR